MAIARQMNKNAWLAATLTLALGMAGCFTAEEPDVFKCGNNESGCQAGYKCDPLEGECVPEDTKLDGRVDGPVVDMGKDIGVDQKKDGPLPDKLIPDVGVSVAPKWVTVKAGTFQMGSPTSEKCREVGMAKESLHKVTLTNDFQIQDIEVTQGQFKALMAYNPSKFTSCGIDCPVEQVDWHEAAAYCNALSAKQGLDNCYACTGSGSSVSCTVPSSYSGSKIYNCPGFRLPTEAEWEYAYRAGTATAFYNGPVVATSCGLADSNLDKIGWYKLNSNNSPHPVRKKQPNIWGLYDMAGNLDEWVHDCYQQDLGTAAVTDPWGPSSCGTSRGVRGGSWATLNVGRMRAAFRTGHTATDTWNYVGFRPVRTLVTPKWVTIKAGIFTVGSPDGTGSQTKEPCRSSNETQHKVTLTNNFEIQNVEVTQGQFKAVMGYSPSVYSNCGGTCPVEQVSWHEAAAYANTLSAKAGKTKCYVCTGSSKSVSCSEAPTYAGTKIYSCPGYRLPTEAEWEYAYRAGTSTAFYNGGITNCSSKDPNLDKIGWYKLNSGSNTHPVGQKTPNAWGLYDMAGNVWEWCHDSYGSYPSSSITDPVGKTGSDRVARGGNYAGHAYYARAAYRHNWAPGFRFRILGFRLSRSVP